MDTAVLLDLSGAGASHTGEATAVETRASEAAFVALVRTEYPALLRTLQLIAGDRDTAHDVAQEAFARLFQHWPKVSGYEAPGAWVRRVAIRLAARTNGRGRKRPAVEAAFSAAQPAAVDPSALARPRDLDLVDAVRRLPHAQRAAVVLHYLEDRPVAEVAHLLGCAEATAKVHLHRGRTRLAELLGEEHDQ